MKFLPKLWSSFTSYHGEMFLMSVRSVINQYVILSCILTFTPLLWTRFHRSHHFSISCRLDTFNIKGGRRVQKIYHFEAMHMKILIFQKLSSSLQLRLYSDPVDVWYFWNCLKFRLLSLGNADHFHCHISAFPHKVAFSFENYNRWWCLCCSHSFSKSGIFGEKKNKKLSNIILYPIWFNCFEWRTFCCRSTVALRFNYCIISNGNYTTVAFLYTVPSYSHNYDITWLCRP